MFDAWIEYDSDNERFDVWTIDRTTGRWHHIDTFAIGRAAIRGAARHAGTDGYWTIKLMGESGPFELAARHRAEMAGYTEDLARFTRGARVELHPSCDLWMRGARFGTVSHRHAGTHVAVKVDHVPGYRIFAPSRLRLV